LTFETEINLRARQKSEVKTELVRGSIEQAGAVTKHDRLATLWIW
jgi:hypothetical protein